MTRAVFISGGASGIGLATARLFASRGWRVGIGDLQPPSEAVAGVSHYSLDVREPNQWRAALEAFCGAGGQLDVLVNNAGITRYAPFEDVPQADSQLIVAVNLGGVINGVYAALPHLRRTPGSCLVNIASAGALYGGVNLAVYSATKFAVRGLSEALDAEFAPYGIKVACVMPWFTESPMVRQPAIGRNASISDDFGKLGTHGPERPAAAIWQAVHGRALHHPVGGQTKLMARIARFLPGLMRASSRAGARKARRS